MLDVKVAVQSAKEYASTALSAELTGVTSPITAPSPFRLEEIRSDDQRFYITLSFPARDPAEASVMTENRNPLVSPLLARMYTREYKVFEVDKQTGAVLTMTNRDFE